MRRVKSSHRFVAFKKTLQNFNYAFSPFFNIWFNIRLHLTDQFLMHKFWSKKVVFRSQLHARNVKMMDLCKKYTHF